MILNDYPEEQISNLINAIGKRVEEVNADQMKELGIDEDENPLIYITPAGILLHYQNDAVTRMTQNALSKQAILEIKDETNVAALEGLTNYYSDKYVEKNESITLFESVVQAIQNYNYRYTRVSVDGTTITAESLSDPTVKITGEINKEDGQIKWLDEENIEQDSR